MRPDTLDDRVPDEAPEDSSELFFQREPKYPRNRVFGYISTDGVLDYSTVKSNPSKSYRAAKRSGSLQSGAVLWEFVMTRQIRRDDAASIARQLLKVR